MTTKKILSIAIPTYNRARWLKLCLENLLPQTQSHLDEVEVSIYDNSSPDNTGEVVHEFARRGFKFNYVLNSKNIGSDANIAQCFNKASGQYVLIFGDDDVMLDGSIVKIINAVKTDHYGAVFIRAYGYDENFRMEKPFQPFKKHLIISGADNFLLKCSSAMTFISSLVINKSIISKTNANKFIGTSIVQTYLLFEAITKNERNLFIEEYLVAAKRIEQRDYDVTKVFSGSLNDAFDSFIKRGLDVSAVRSIKQKLLWYFYPIFLINLRLDKASNAGQAAKNSYERLYSQNKNEFFFWICTFPILKFPKNIAILWGFALIIISRLCNLEFGRLFVAIKNKLRKS
jgi:glycosyltransferase involved in cell wall biosynthesis